MIITDEKVAIIDEAINLAEQIIQSEPFHNYLSCYYNLEKNDQSQLKIKRFQAAKERYDEAKKYGKYHPDYKASKEALFPIKREMDYDDLVHKFKSAEGQLQEMLDNICLILGRAVSEEILIRLHNEIGFPKTCNSSQCKCNK